MSDRYGTQPPAETIVPSIVNVDGRYGSYTYKQAHPPILKCSIDVTDTLLMKDDRHEVYIYKGDALYVDTESWLLKTEVI